MGHQVCYCDFCGSSVMEGHNDWKCECGAYMDITTGFKWTKSSSIKFKDIRPEGKPIGLKKYNINQFKIF